MKTSSSIKKKKKKRNYRLCENLMKTHNSDTIALIEKIATKLRPKNFLSLIVLFARYFWCVNIKQTNKKKKCLNLKQ